MNTDIVPVETPVGLGRLHLDGADGSPTVWLVLGHGAGGGVDAADLVLLAQVLPPLGVSVARFEQPWRVAGRKIAGRPAQLDLAWVAAVRYLMARGMTERGSMGPGSMERGFTERGDALRLFVSGRSAGARVACRTANELGVAGVVCLAFPLHPPGRPGKSRIAELQAPTAPRLVLQGTRDAFGGPADLSAELSAQLEGTVGITVVPLPGADHGFRVPRTGEFTAVDLRSEVASRVAAFVLS